MSRIISQDVNRVRGGGRGSHGINIVSTVAVVENGTDTVVLPRMSKSSGPCAAIVVRPGDSTSVTLTQTNITTVTLSNTSGARQSIMIVSLHDDPIPNPVGDGA